MISTNNKKSNIFKICLNESHVCEYPKGALKLSIVKLRWAWLEDGEMKELLKKSKPVDAMDIEREDENENLSAMFD